MSRVEAKRDDDDVNGSTHVLAVVPLPEGMA